MHGSEDYRYTGKHEDPSGLYYYGARYYDPLVGRFTTRDTVFGDLGDPQSLNRYLYCVNNPHKYTDPDGRWANIAIGAGVGGIMGGGWYAMTHRGENFKWSEFAGATASGMVGGAVMSMGGMGLGLGGKIALRAASSTLSFATDTLVTSMAGGKVDEMTASEIVTDIGLSVALSTVIGEGVKKVDAISKTPNALTKALHKNPILKEPVDAWWFNSPVGYTSASVEIGQVSPPRLIKKAVSHIINTWDYSPSLSGYVDAGRREM